MIALDSGDKIRGDASAASVVDYSLHGLDNNAIKQLSDGQLAAATGDLYTADSTDVASAIILVNTDSSARTVNLFLLPSGGTARRIIPKDMSLGVGYCLLTDGQKIGVYDASGNLQQTVTIVAHALGGSSHDADTLSDLNSKVSDATLVDTAGIILQSLLTTQNDIVVRGASIAERLAMPASRIVARLASGNVVAATVAEILTLIGVAAGADVTGPATSTDNEIARQHSTTGKVLQTYTSNPPTISDTGDVNIDGDLDVENIVVSGNVDGKDVSGLATAAEAKAASVQSGAITNGVTLAPTHDAVFDVKTTADAAQPASTDDADAVAAVEAAGLTFAEDKGIILDAVLSGDAHWTGITQAGTAGVALAVGDLVYLESTGKWLLAKADAATTCSGMLGMVVLAANGDTDPTNVLLYGKIRAATLPALTVGEPVYVSEDDAGDVEDAAPAGSGQIVRIVGYGATAEDLFFCPDNTYIELA